MLIGRFWIAIPTLALAGSFARKPTIHLSAGALPTHTDVRYLAPDRDAEHRRNDLLPALALGPIAEHLLNFGPSQ